MRCTPTCCPLAEAPSSLPLRLFLCAGIQIHDADEFLPTLEKALEMQASKWLAPALLVCSNKGFKGCGWGCWRCRRAAARRTFVAAAGLSAW